MQGRARYDNPSRNARRPGGQTQTYVFTMNGRQYVYTTNGAGHPFNDFDQFAHAHSSHQHFGFENNHRTGFDAFRTPSATEIVLQSLARLFFPLFMLGLLLVFFSSLQSTQPQPEVEAEPQPQAQTQQGDQNPSPASSKTRSKASSSVSVGVHAKSNRFVCLCLTDESLSAAQTLSKAFPDIVFFKGNFKPSVWTKWLDRVLQAQGVHDDAVRNGELHIVALARQAVPSLRM
jgi:hypothetical protein